MQAVGLANGWTACQERRLFSLGKSSLGTERMGAESSVHELVGARCMHTSDALAGRRRNTLKVSHADVSGHASRNRACAKLDLM